MNRRRTARFLLPLMACLALSACSRAPVRAPEAGNAGMRAQARPAEEDAVLKATHITITAGGVGLTLPMTAAEIEAAGFAAKAEPSALGPDSMSGPVTFEGHGTRFTSYLYNPGASDAPGCDLPVVWVVFDAGEQNAGVMAPGGIVLGQSVYRDLLTAYGEPDETIDDGGIRLLRYGMGLDLILYAAVDMRTELLVGLEVLAFPAEEDAA